MELALWRECDVEKKKDWGDEANRDDLPEEEQQIGTAPVSDETASANNDLQGKSPPLVNAPTRLKQEQSVNPRELRQENKSLPIRAMAFGKDVHEREG